MKAQALVDALLASRGFLHKRDISDVITSLGKSLPTGVSDLSQAIAVGDDCAAIADGDGYLLFAIEGFVEDFVQRMPWFAGYCGVMVNVSDIYAMGGRPIAIVDALWSRGMTPADAVLAGLAVASQRYAVPIVGGHSNNRSERGQLAVAILGRAKKLLSSFTAQPGDELLMVVDLRGEYQESYPYWNASTLAPAERLRADLELLPTLAESGLCDTAKDISMAGAIGTTLMMLDCSRVGATIRVDDVPRPAGISSDDALLRWLTAFPSYGFVLSVRPHNTAAVLAQFQQRGLAAASIGNITADTQVVLHHQSETATLWDTGSQHFITAQSSTSSPAEPAVRLAYA
jgi:AIR synthase-related protein